MKLFDPFCSFVLASFLWNFSLASIEFHDFADAVRAGATYNVSWVSDRDYVSHPHAALLLALNGRLTAPVDTEGLCAYAMGGQWRLDKARSNSRSPG